MMTDQEPVLFSTSLEDFIILTFRIVAASTRIVTNSFGFTAETLNGSYFECAAPATTVWLRRSPASCWSTSVVTSVICLCVKAASEDGWSSTSWGGGQPAAA